MKPSLSASALKVLALFTMLLDHMAYYLYLPEPLRWVGRLAAPIFLFFVVEGFGRTRNYKKYLLRVYAVAAGMGITNALLRQYAGGLRPDGITPTNGICATFFLLLVILQGLKRMEQRRWDGILLVAGPFVLPLLLELMDSSSNTALIASYIAKFGDPDALPRMKQALEDPAINYLDYVEIANAVRLVPVDWILPYGEGMGGEVTSERTFDGDPYYESMKKLG